MKKSLLILTIAIITNSLVPLIVSNTKAGYNFGFENILNNPAHINIPEDYGDIIEKWIPEMPIDSKPLIIFIQDAHCNYEVQKNISCLIDNIMANYSGQLKLVAIEGSSGVIDTSIFESFTDEQIKKRVSDYFMKEGKISGAEFLSITGPHDFTLYGIEDKELYNRNYKAFLDSLAFRDTALEYFEYIRGIMAELKGHIYTDNLKEFDEHLKSYQNGDIGFPEYMNILKECAEKQAVDLAGFKDFMSLSKLYQIENGIDFDMLYKEREQLINMLGSTLDKQKLSELVSKSLDFRTGKLSAAEYYNYLINLAKEDYHNLFSYAGYLKINEGIDRNAILSECSEIEDLIVKGMFENNDQHKLFILSKNLNILHKIFRLELTKEEYLYYMRHRNNFSAVNFHKHIKLLADRYGIGYNRWPGLSEMDNNLAVIEEFYKLAIERESVFIDNTLKQMEIQGVNTCILITGGFHTKGISEILKERDIAYVVLSPKINKKQEYNPYIDVMKGQKMKI